MFQWLRKRQERKYERLDQELAAEKGSNSRWKEVAPREWWCVGTVDLEKPFPPVRKIRIAGETFYVRQMRTLPEDLEK